ASMMPHYNVYLEDLKKAGIDARVEQMSHSTISKRIDNHDFDLYWAAWGASRLRDPEASWHSSTADQPASNNFPGLKDARIDARLAELVPYVFLWQSEKTRLLYWNRFGTPAYVLDKFNREDAVIPYWFVDSTKNANVESRIVMPVDTGVVRYED